MTLDEKKSGSAAPQQRRPNIELRWAGSEDYGELFHLIRESKGLTQAQVAERYTQKWRERYPNDRRPWTDRWIGHIELSAKSRPWLSCEQVDLAQRGHGLHTVRVHAAPAGLGPCVAGRRAATHARGEPARARYALPGTPPAAAQAPRTPAEERGRSRERAARTDPAGSPPKPKSGSARTTSSACWQSRRFSSAGCAGARRPLRRRARRPRLRSPPTRRQRTRERDWRMPWDGN